MKGVVLRGAFFGSTGAVVVTAPAIRGPHQIGDGIRPMPRIALAAGFFTFPMGAARTAALHALFERAKSRPLPLPAEVLLGIPPGWLNAGLILVVATNAHGVHP